MFVNNDLVHDARVTRHAETLGRCGYDVQVICMKSDRTQFSERRSSYSVRRCQHSIWVRQLITAREIGRAADDTLSFPRSIVDQLKRTLIFFLRILDTNVKFAKAAKDFDAQIYASNDLDTLLAGVLAAGLSRRLVYDAHELFPDMLEGMGYSCLQVAFVRALESVLVKRADCVMTVNGFISKELANRYKIPKPHVVLNVPRMERQINTRAREDGVKVALYQGLYMKGRGLENLVQACEFLLDDVRLVMRGFGEIVENQLRNLAKRFPNCRFEKAVPANRTVQAAQKADIGIIQYLPINANNRFSSPNKLFEYIQAGLPVISTNASLFLREIVTGNGIGYLFDPTDPRDIAMAINRATRNTALRSLKKRVLKIRRAYSWDLEQSKLIKIYAHL